MKQIRACFVRLEGGDGVAQAASRVRDGDRPVRHCKQLRADSGHQAGKQLQSAIQLTPTDRQPQAINVRRHIRQSMVRQY